MQIKNPRGMYLLATFSGRGGGPENRCTVQNGALSTIRCNFSSAGTYDVQFFSNAAQFGEFGYAGQLEVNSD